MSKQVTECYCENKNDPFETALLLLNSGGVDTSTYESRINLQMRMFVMQEFGFWCNYKFINFYGRPFSLSFARDLNDINDAAKILHNKGIQCDFVSNDYDYAWKMYKNFVEGASLRMLKMTAFLCSMMFDEGIDIQKSISLASGTGWFGPDELNSANGIVDLILHVRQKLNID